jgi:3-hydroxyisobutyrate dehydrogenase-like beta-hydroxyacid dehydrogenase
VGFFGLGTMGSGMAADVARSGYPVPVWNRTPGQAGAALVARGHGEDDNSALARAVREWSGM